MSDFNSYRIVNPAHGNDYFDTNGSATAATTQPKVDGGATTMPGTSSRSPANLDASRISRSQENLYGSKLNANLSGGAGGFWGSGQGTTAIAARTFASMVAGQYIMVRGGANTQYIAGTADTNLRSGGLPAYTVRRSINARQRVRGPLTATAIRAGYWHAISGIFFVEQTGAGGVPYLQPQAPTSSTDGLGTVGGSAAGDQDVAATADQAVLPTGSIPGELVFIGGNASTILIPTLADYQVRTTM